VTTASPAISCSSSARCCAAAASRTGEYFVGTDTSFEKLFAIKLRNWVDGCTKNTRLEAPGEAGLAVQKMLDGIYRSAAAGKEVMIT
jgi:hypothetical protein